VPTSQCTRHEDAWRPPRPSSKLRETMDIRGSEIGLCKFYLAAKALGMSIEPPGGFLRTIFESGKKQEEGAIAWLESEWEGEVDLQPVRVVDRQREVVLDLGEDRIVGHIDGRTENSLIEIKAMSQERFAGLAKGVEEAIDLQMAAYALGLLAAGVDICSAVLVGKLWEQEEYRTHEDCGDSFYYWLDIRREDIERKVAEVKELVNMVAQGKATLEQPNSPRSECRDCGARFNCYPALLEKERAMALEIAKPADEQDQKALEDYARGAELVKEGEALKKAAQEHFAYMLAEGGPRKVEAKGLGNVTRTETVRKKYDYKLIEKLAGEKWPECYEEETSTSLRITVGK